MTHVPSAAAGTSSMMECAANARSVMILLRPKTQNVPRMGLTDSVQVSPIGALWKNVLMTFQKMYAPTNQCVMTMEIAIAMTPVDGVATLCVALERPRVALSAALVTSMMTGVVSRVGSARCPIHLGSGSANWMEMMISVAVACPPLNHQSALLLLLLLQKIQKLE